MDDQCYETSDQMTLEQAIYFMQMFDEKIGTDRELNPSASGEPNEYYVFCTDLLDSEIPLCRELETKALNHKNGDHHDN